MGMGGKMEIADSEMKREKNEVRFLYELEIEITCPGLEKFTGSSLSLASRLY